MTHNAARVGGSERSADIPRALAASFTDRPDADAALAALRTAFRLAFGQATVAALGHATYPVLPESVLAGRFEDADIAAVRSIVARYGGIIVTDVDSRRT